MLKCCKNKNLYDTKIHFHSIKIILYLIKHIFIISVFFHGIKCFHSIKTNLYSIKYIFIIAPFFPWYQNIFSFSQNKFVFSKKHFHYMYFFHSSKIYFYYMNFSLNTFMVNISGLPFVFTKARILLSVCKLNNSTIIWIFMWILINSFMTKELNHAEQIKGLVSTW